MKRLLQRGRVLAYGAAVGIRNALCAATMLTGAVQAEPVVIAALGDSLTQGYGLTPDQGLVPQLERWLIAQGEDVRLVNAGVSGDTTAGGLSRVEWTLTTDVQAMIVTLGGNDLLRGIDPAETRKNLDGILSTAAERGVALMLVGFEAPLNYGPDYKLAFDVAYPELAATYNAIYAPALFQALQGAGRPMTDFMQGDMIHPNAEGVALIVDALGPKVLELIARVSR